ncbi:hypothetical protein PUG46_15990 [Erwiniaceae bacterium L1_55_4]|nr:hypothetical protein [Erwiniaceae bacterium L1_55_4]
MKNKALISLILLVAGASGFVQAQAQTGTPADGEAYLQAVSHSGDPDVASVLGDINAAHRKACGESYSADQLRAIASQNGDYAALLSVRAMDKAEYQQKLNASFTRCD